MEDFKREIYVMQSTYQRMASKKGHNQDFNSFINEMMDKLEDAGYWDADKRCVK